MTCTTCPRAAHRPAPAPGRPGFTVLELLVTAGVAVLVLGALYLLLERQVTLYGRGEAKADVQQVVRVALGEMASNLRAAGNGVPRGTSGAGALYIFYNGITVNGVLLETNATTVTILGDIDGTAAELTAAVTTGGTSVSVANACIVPRPPTGDDCRDYSLSLTGGPNTVVVSSTGILGGAPFGTWAYGRYTGPPNAGVQSSIPVAALSTPAGTPATFQPGAGVAALEVVQYRVQGTNLVRLIGLYGGQTGATGPTINILWGQPETLLDNVAGLTFTYFDATNAAVAAVAAPGDPGIIRRVRIRLQLQTGKGLPDAVHSTDVRLRTL